MTKLQEVKVIKGVIALVIGAIIGLLSVIAVIMVDMNHNFIAFMKQNSEEHTAIQKVITRHESIYKYEIHPNTLRSKNNETRLTKGGL